MPIQAVAVDIEWPQSKESMVNWWHWRENVDARGGRWDLRLPCSSSSLAWLVRTSSHSRSCVMADSDKVATKNNVATTMSDFDDGFKNWLGMKVLHLEYLAERSTMEQRKACLNATVQQACHQPRH
jgi:hypothetical protein